MSPRSSIPLFVLAYSATAVFAAAFAAPFVQDPSPSPADQCKLNAIAASPSGRVAAAGFERTYMVGGSPGLPLVIEKTASDGTWSVLDSPHLGATWHDLDAIEYLPGHPDEDLVAVGWYLPDPLLAYPDGVVMRYHRAAGQWDLETFLDPASEFLFTRDVAFDPFDADRILICGVRGIADPGGFCFRFTTLVVSFRLDTMTYEILPTTALGALFAITALPDGRFVAFGVGAHECDYNDEPIVLLIDGESATVMPNPPSWPGHPYYQLNGSTLLPDGRVMVVGHASRLQGADSVTIAYRFDPIASTWEVFKPIDPDTTDLPSGYRNQLFGATTLPDGRVYAVGRYHYIHADGGHHHHALIQSFDGDEWRLEETPEAFAESWNTQIWNAAAHPTAGVWAAGWYDPDDFEDKTLVVREDVTTTAVAPGIADPVTCRAFPSPFTGSTTLRFTPVPTGEVTVEIHDLAGRRIRRLTADATTASWDGRDAAGRPVAAGVYSARILAEGREVGTMRLVKLR